MDCRPDFIDCRPGILTADLMSMASLIEDLIPLCRPDTIDYTVELISLTANLTPLCEDLTSHIANLTLLTVDLT